MKKKILLYIIFILGISVSQAQEVDYYKLDRLINKNIKNGNFSKFPLYEDLSGFKTAITKNNQGHIVNNLIVSLEKIALLKDEIESINTSFKYNNTHPEDTELYREQMRVTNSASSIRRRLNFEEIAIKTAKLSYNLCKSNNSYSNVACYEQQQTYNNLIRKKNTTIAEYNRLEPKAKAIYTEYNEYQNKYNEKGKKTNTIINNKSSKLKNELVNIDSYYNLLSNSYYEDAPEKITIETFYKNGKKYVDSYAKKPGNKYKYKSGISKIYFENGNIKEEGNFENGFREGITKLYTEKGELYSERKYQKGKLVEEPKKEAYEEVINIDSSTKMIKTYSAKSILSQISVGKINSKGNNDGQWITYLTPWSYEAAAEEVGVPDHKMTDALQEMSKKIGKPIKLYTLEDEKIFIKQKKYVNETIHKIGNYKDGLKVGLHKQFLDNGTLQEEEEFFENKTIKKTYSKLGVIRSESIIENRLQTSWKAFKKGVLDWHLTRFVDGTARKDLYYPNGNLEKRLPYNDKNNEYYNGQMKSYYEDGELKHEGTYIKGYLEGDYKIYYKSGVLNTVGKVKKNDWQGVRSTYHENGSLLNKGEMKDDKKHGEWFYYYEGGNIKMKTTYLKGEHNGKRTLYYENGNIKEENLFQNGLHHGETIIYHENKKQHVIANYFEGKRDGLAKWYYDNGQLETVIEYKYDANQKEGLRWNAHKRYDINGKKLKKGTLKNGNGTLNSYDENGNLTSVTTYKNGIEVEE